jgi:hypothetical protein
MAIELFDAVKRILSEVEKETGKAVILKEDNSISYFAIAKTARSNMPNHFILYKAIHEDILNHLIAHECGHLIRTSKEKINRLIPCSDYETNQKAFEDVFRKSLIRLSIETLKKVIPMWTGGLITQVTSMPEDVRIETWIYNNYPELRAAQKESIQKQIDQVKKGLETEYAKMIPKFVFDASGIISYFYIRSLEDIIGESANKVFENQEFIGRAKNIYAEAQNIMLKEDSMGNSIEVSNYLAEMVGISKWFKWCDFEDVPDGYGK